MLNIKLTNQLTANMCKCLFVCVCCARSHEGPVWQVAWAHPMFGNVLASCSYDRKVIVWKEENGSWDKMYEYTGHESSGQDTCCTSP